MEAKESPTSEPAHDNMDQEMIQIQLISRSLDNFRSIQSAGTDISLEHLLAIPELSEVEEPDEETVEFIEELISNDEEQRRISETNEEVEEAPLITIREDAASIEDENEAETQESPREDEQIASSSSSQSRFSFFSAIFGSPRKASTSSSSSSATSYLSRLFSRKKPDTSGPTSNFSIPSCNSQNDRGEVDSVDMEAAERLIAETEAQGPAGTPHLSAVARTVHRPILAFSSSMTLRHHAGRDFDAAPIMIQFHSARPDLATGHWTLLGNHDPEGIPMTLNNCLFNVVFAQTGKKPSDLRRETIREMRLHIKSLARRIRAMMQREQCEGLVILIGGASYTGSSAADARQVIDSSQGARCHPGNQQGHPRGHASHPGASGPTESAENYSRGGWKSGFLSREDQNAVGHRALSTDQAQRAMESLNRGSTNEAVKIRADQLGGSLPEGAEFRDGRMDGPQSIRQLVLVLRHHAGHANDPDYPVFVHTFYPVVT